MKSVSKPLGAAALALAALAALSACKNQLPVSGSYASNPKDYTTVVTYDALSGNTGLVNPTLLNTAAGSGDSYLLLAGGGLHSFNDWIVSGPLAVVNLVPPTLAAGDTTRAAAHDVETFKDIGDGAYPSNQIRVRLLSAGLYDLSAFSGVKFMLYVTSNDDALKRRFAIATDVTLPPSDDNSGTCNGVLSNSCRNNFGVAMTTPTGSWTQFTYAFTDLTQEAGYGAVSPPTFLGHIKNVIWLQWEEGRNNSYGVCHVDYWLDQVSFY